MSNTVIEVFSVVSLGWRCRPCPQEHADDVNPFNPSWGTLPHELSHCQVFPGRKHPNAQPCTPCGACGVYINTAPPARLRCISGRLAAARSESPARGVWAMAEDTGTPSSSPRRRRHRAWGRRRCSAKMWFLWHRSWNGAGPQEGIERT